MKIKVEQTYQLDDFGRRECEGELEFTKLPDGTIINYGRSLPF